MTAESKNDKHRTILFTAKFIFVFLLSFTVLQRLYPSPDEKIWVIVIDPGHGGRDPGAIGKYSREKDINLAIALKTGSYLEKNLKNVKVVYTRKVDKTVDLYDRPKIANDNNADLFISIHANKTTSASVAGAETFIMGLTKDKENLAVAMKENEVIYLEDGYSTKYQGFDPKSPESYIMFTLMQNVYQKQSTNLASKIQTQFTERVSRRDRGVKQAGFWVLFNTAMPSVLIETGFLSNVAEERFLMSDEGQDYMASAIFRACREYINEVNNRSIVLTNLKEDNFLVEPSPALPLLPVFMVQVASSVKKIEIRPDTFKGLKDIAEIASDGRYKYVSGKFQEYTDAVKHRKELSNLYPDAFIIAVRNDTVMPLQQAINMIKMK